MLVKDFYTTDKIDTSEGKFVAGITLNPDHEIYEGHFPEQPVVPGVFQLQIVKELLEEVLGEKLLLSHMTFAKFLNLIKPEYSPLKIVVDHKNETSQISVSARIENAEQVFTKVKCSFTFTA